jgi:hypothetical protein
MKAVYFLYRKDTGGVVAKVGGVKLSEVASRFQQKQATRL